jgi:ABC-2 type transport system permease protein
MLERLKHMLIKEFIQVFRDRKVFGMIFLAPLIQLVIFGYAASTDVRHIVTAVYDLDGTVASRDLAARFERSGYFGIATHISREDEVQDLVDHGRAMVVLRINKGFEEDLLAGRTGVVQMIVDGADSNTAGIVLAYSRGIASGYSRGVLETRLARLQPAARRAGQVTLATRAWFNDNLESRNFFVPGVIANIVALLTLMLTSMAVVREKEIGTMEQIMVTPIRPVEFILGKTVPFVLIALFDVVLITVVGVFWFEVPIRGSLPLLLLASVLYLMSMLGVGLLISTVSVTQQQAMMTTFFFFFPAMLLSGFMFPIANMPEVIQWITYLNPLRYFLVILRGLFLKGVGLDVLAPQLGALAALGVATLWLAVRRFHKTLT